MRRFGIDTFGGVQSRSFASWRRFAAASRHRLAMAHPTHARQTSRSKTTSMTRIAKHERAAGPTSSGRASVVTPSDPSWLNGAWGASVTGSASWAAALVRLVESRSPVRAAKSARHGRSGSVPSNASPPRVSKVPTAAVGLASRAPREPPAPAGRPSQLRRDTPPLRPGPGRN